MNQIIDEELLSLGEFRDLMFQAIIPIKAVTDYKGKPIYEMFAYWRRHKVLPFIPVGQHWEDHFEINCIQLIWLRILDSLRQLNYPLLLMKELCKYYFEDSYKNDIPIQILSHNKKQLEEKKKHEVLKENEDGLLQYIDSLLLSKEARIFMYSQRNYLSEIIIESITVGQDTGILLYPDGNILEHVGDFKFNHKGPIEFDTTAPHIYLSMKHFLKEFITDDQLENIVMSNILNLDERNVLEELRNENIQELTIKKNGKIIERIDTTNGGIITGEKAKEIKRLLGLKNYEDIEFSTRDEKTLSFKKKRKKFIINK